jgi:flagellar hook-associated protein 1 FlgK
MGLLNSALHIGRNAILGYQGALQTIGSNISSVGSPDYTRLAPHMTPLQGTLLGAGLQPGAGVALTDIRRNVDEALEGRLRLALGERESTLKQQEVLTRMETYFDDIRGTGVSSQLSAFFNTFDDLQNTPEDAAIRDLTISSGAQLASSLQSLGTQITRIREDADSQIADLVQQADKTARGITDLNKQIAVAEASSSGTATGLRDQRDALLRELSRYFDVTVRSQSDGTINVYVGSETLIQGNMYRGLTTVGEVDGTFTQTSIRFADTEAEVDVSGGCLGGIVAARDTYGDEQVTRLNQLAAALICEVNRLHADGQGSVGMSEVMGSYHRLATDVARSSAETGLKHSPHNGSFFITVADDATGTPVSYRIDVALEGSDNDTTLESLVADFNAQVTGVTAEITSDNRLKLTAEDGFTFTFGHDGNQPREDTSHVLAALGINTFFTGSDASDIAVNETLIEQPALLAASSVYLSGDGTTARRVADLSGQAGDLLGGVSITGFYNTIVGSVAVEAAAANERTEASATVLASLTAQRESVSGVSLDEEAIELLKYERSFQGAARYIRVVDDLIAELVALIR